MFYQTESCFHHKLPVVPTANRAVVCSHISRPVLIQSHMRERMTAPCTRSKIPALSWAGKRISVHSERQGTHNPAQTNLQHQILLYPLSLPQHSIMQAAGQEVEESTASLALLAPRGTQQHLSVPGFPAGVLEDCLYTRPSWAPLSPHLFVCMRASKTSLRSKSHLRHELPVINYWGHRMITVEMLIGNSLIEAL